MASASAKYIKGSLPYQEASSQKYAPQHTPERIEVHIFYFPALLFYFSFANPYCLHYTEIILKNICDLK